MTPSHTKIIFKSTAVRDENHQVMPYNIEDLIFLVDLLSLFILQHVLYLHNLQIHFWFQCVSENYSNFRDSCNMIAKICLVFLDRVTVVAL